MREVSQKQQQNQFKYSRLERRNIYITNIFIIVGIMFGEIGYTGYCLVSMNTIHLEKESLKYSVPYIIYVGFIDFVNLRSPESFSFTSAYIGFPIFCNL